MPIPDFFEPLVGYRVWRVMKGGLLTGVHVCEPWAPKQAHRATCQRKFGAGIFNGMSWSDDTTSPHLTNGVYVPAPTLDCHCGLWAKRTEDKLHECADVPEAGTQEGFAWGAAWIWGHIIEHMLGWRAEFAYPKALKATSDAVNIAALYGIPCEAVQVVKPKRIDDDDMYFWGKSTWMIPKYQWKSYPTHVTISSTPLVTYPVIQEATPNEMQTELEKVKARPSIITGGWT